MKKLLVGLVFLTGLAVYGWGYPVTINMDWLYDWGRIYQVDPNSGTVSAVNTNPYYVHNPGPNANGVTDDGVWNGWGDEKEDAYSILRITSITGFYNAATADYELTAFFYGLDHIGIDPATGVHYGRGGYVEIYKHPPTNYGVTPDTAPDPTERTGTYTFPPITEGELVLRLQGGKLGEDPLFGEYSYKGKLEDLGSGWYYISSSLALNVVGGSWAPYFDTNTQINNTDLLFLFQTTSKIDTEQDHWTLKDGSGTASGDLLVPEPSSVALLSLGLIGLGLVRRKRG